MLRPNALLLLVSLWAPLGGGAAVAQSWLGDNRAQGLVTDDQGVPLADATVTLSFEDAGGPKPVTTSKKGRFSLLGLTGGTWKVSIEADGYVPREDSLVVYDVGVSETVRFALKKVPAEAQEANRRERLNERLTQANALARDHQPSKARAVWEGVLGEVSEAVAPAVMVGIASTYVQENEQEQAREWLEKALAVDPNREDALRLMVSILAAQGNAAAAQEYVERLSDSAKLDPSAQVNLGILRYNEGNLEAAATIFERLLAAQPEHPDALYFAGLVHVNQAKNEQALAELSKLLDLHPDYARAEEARKFVAHLQQ